MEKEYTLQELQQMGAQPADHEYTYEELQNMQQQFNQSQQPQQPKRIGFLQQAGNFTGNLSQGIGQGLTSTALGLGQIALKGASRIPFLPQNTRRLFQEGVQTGEDIKNTQLQPQNIAQGLGKFGEQIGEMFILTGLEAKVASKLAEIPELAKNTSLIAKILKTGVKSATSAAEFGGKTYLQTGGDAKKALETGVIAGAVEPAAGVIKGLGRAIAEFPISLSSRESQLVQSYKAGMPFWERVLSGAGLVRKAGEPVTAGKTAFEKGFLGTESMIGIQAKRGANNLWKNSIEPALKSSKVKQNMTSFWNEAKQQIIKENPELNRQKDLLEALEAIKEPYNKIKNVTLWYFYINGLYFFVFMGLRAKPHNLPP